MSTTIALKVQTLTENLHLTQEQVGKIVGASSRTISRWSAGETAPQTDARSRLLELAYVGEAVSEVLKPEDANLWIFSPNKLLGGDTPAERIQAGDYKSVLALIEALAEGVVT